MGHHARRRTVPAAGLVLGLLLTGCSDDGQGYRAIEQGRLHVAVLDSWEPVDLEGATAFDLVLQDEPDDEDLTYRFAASSDYPDRSARGAIAQLQSSGGFIPDESGGVSRVERDDDLAMWRWDLTYGDGEFQTVAWALTEDEHTVVVTLAGRGGLDPAMIERVGDSIEILSESEPEPEQRSG